MEYRTSNVERVLNVIYGIENSISRVGIKFPGGIRVLFWEGYELNFTSMMPEKVSIPAILKNARHTLSLIGSATSICILAIIVACETLWSESPRLATRGKRDQLGVLLSKLSFHVALCAATLLRSFATACKVTAIALHYSMFVCFGFSIMFGNRVAAIFWGLQSGGGAVVAQAGAGQGIGASEIATWVGIWFGNAFVLIGLWIFDTYVDSSMIGYGINGFCYVSGSDGLLYFVVIPTSAVVLLNVITLIYSSFHFLRVVTAARGNLSASMILLFKFMAKLVAVQMLQWIFGLLYHFVPKETVGIVFECLVGFEGVYILVVVYRKQFFCALAKCGLTMKKKDSEN